jgi:rfaE bifunctional protein kinase chain/domain
VTDTVSKALKLMEGRRVLIVGDVMLDSYLYGETVRVSREAPVIVVRKDSVEHRLGGAANTAANLAALGANTELIGVVGKDEGGGRLRAMLSEQRVDIAGLVEVSVTTPVKTRVMAGAVGTSRQQVLRIDDEPSGLPSEAAIRSVVDSL